MTTLILGNLPLFIAGGVVIFLACYIAFKIKQAEKAGRQRERIERDRLAQKKRDEAAKVVRKPVSKAKTKSKLRKG